MPPKISTTATLDDVKSLSGLQEQEWEAFLRITFDRINNISNGDTVQSWQTITPGERTQVCEGVQQDLKAQGLPKVIDNIVRWRLSQVACEIDQGADRG